MNDNGQSLDHLREQTRLHRARSRLAAAKAEADIVESFASPGALSFGADWSTILNPFQGYQHDSFFGMGWMHDAGGIHGKQDGRYHPFLWTDTDLDRQRSFARWLATKNGVAQGALRTLTNFIVKTGYTWEVAPAKPYRESPEVVQLAAQVQEIIDEFADLNGLPQRERSAVNRAVRDGEVITRTFDIDDQTILRFVEPEQLREPPDAEPNCALGVETDPMDVEDVWQYWVTYDGTEFDAVSAVDVQHLKRNVDECVKRGLSDFLSTGELIDGIAKLIRNMGAGAAASSAIAWIEQFKQTTATQASQHLAAIKDLRRPIIQHPLTGRDLTTQQLQPGTVVKVDENREYLPPPSASNTQQYVEIVQAMMRFAGARWGMPEYLVSADASNASYSSTMVAGSPFVSSIECEQDFFGQYFLKWRWIAIRNACRHGRISGYSFEQIQRLVDIHYTPPQVAVANEGERAQVDHQDLAAGVMSLQTRRKRIGLDDEQELANLKKEPPTRVSGQATDIDAMGNPVQPDGSPEANGGQGMLQGLGESLEPTWDDLQEAVAQKRKVGDVWQGPSGRWFTVSQSGRVVPAKNPHAEVKKPKVAKAAKADPEVAKARIRDMFAAGKARGTLSPDEVKEMAAHIMSLTVPHIDALKKELNLPASGTKAGKAIKMAQRALAAVGKRPEEPAAEPSAQEPTAVEPKFKTGQIAKLVGVGQPTIKRWVDRGVLKLGPDGTISKADLDAFLTDHGMGSVDELSNRAASRAEHEAGAKPEGKPLNQQMREEPWKHRRQDMMSELQGIQRRYKGSIQDRELQKAAQLQTHRTAVADALAAGKSVPPEVLADYPDLKPGGEKQPKPPKPGFTGTDSQGRKWVDGELVAKEEEPVATKEPKAEPVAKGGVAPHEQLLSHFADLEHTGKGSKIINDGKVHLDPGQATIPEMFEKSGMNPEEFKSAMFRLRREGKIRLIAAGDRAAWEPEQLRKGIEGENETFMVAERTDDTPAAAKGTSKSEPSGKPTRETAASSLSSAIQAAAKGAGDLPDTPYGPAMAPRLSGDIGKDLRQLAQIDTSHLDQRYKQMNATGHYKGNNEVFRRLNDEFSRFKSSADRGMPVSADEIHQAMDTVATRFAQAGAALDAMGEKKLSDYYTTHGAATVKAARDHALANYAYKEEEPVAPKAEPAAIVHTPEHHAKAVQALSDGAFAAMKAREDAQRARDPEDTRKLGDVVTREATIQKQKVKAHFDDLRQQIKTRAEAAAIWKAAGWKTAPKGNKDAILGDLEKILLRRIGTFERPYA